MTENILAIKKAKKLAIVYKTLNINQDEPHYKPGLKPDVPKGIRCACFTR